MTVFEIVALIAAACGLAIVVGGSWFVPVEPCPEPCFSERDGRFGWVAIPLRPEAHYLEVYRGSNLAYRQPIQATALAALRPIRL